MSNFLYYPVKDSVNKTNLFGANPAQYKPLGRQGHPGLDFMSPSGTQLFCPVDGLAFYTTDSLGGDGIWIRTTQFGQNYNIILWHLYPAGNLAYPFNIPTDRTMVYVKAGQVLGFTDNSGFPAESTGPHLHVGVMPADENWHPVFPNNGFSGCVDPTPFFNGLYAQDINKPPLPPVPVLPPNPTIPETKDWLDKLSDWLGKVVKYLQK